MNIIVQDLIKYSTDKFSLDLKNYTVLTEAASGNYVCTPLLAAYAGANVYSFGRDSKYSKYKNVKNHISKLARSLNIKKITFLDEINDIDLTEVDIFTNTGFLRPINKDIIEKLDPNCVIPLMYEPWEFRKTDLDLDYCAEKGIKVYGTNESDSRLLTMSYIGYTILYFLLKEKRTPIRTRILLLGSEKFNIAIKNVLDSLNYYVDKYTTEEYDLKVDISWYNVIVCTEFVMDDLLIGKWGAKINKDDINREQLIIHIAGNVDLNGLKCKFYPKEPAPTNYMSYTTDFIDPLAVVNLNCAGLKVAEGMKIANKKNFTKLEYKTYMEKYYPALAFKNSFYW